MTRAREVADRGHKASPVITFNRNSGVQAVVIDTWTVILFPDPETDTYKAEDFDDFATIIRDGSNYAYGLKASIPLLVKANIRTSVSVSVNEAYHEMYVAGVGYWLKGFGPSSIHTSSSPWIYCPAGADCYTRYYEASGGSLDDGTIVSFQLKQLD